MKYLGLQAADGTVHDLVAIVLREDGTDQYPEVRAEWDALAQRDGEDLVEFEADAATLDNVDARPYAVERGRLVPHPVIVPARRRAVAQRDIVTLRERKAAIERAATIEGGDWSELLAKVDQELDDKRAELAAADAAMTKEAGTL